MMKVLSIHPVRVHVYVYMKMCNCSYVGDYALVHVCVGCGVGGEEHTSISIILVFTIIP